MGDRAERHLCPRCADGRHSECVEVFNPRWRDRCGCARSNHETVDDFRRCSIDGCDRLHCARGWCRPHYRRWSRTGEPGPAELGRKRRRQIGCSVDGCRGAHYARGWCSVHYYRWKRDGDPGAARTSPRRVCSLDECVRPHHGRGYCGPHLRRLQRYGDPRGGRPVPPPRLSRCRVETCGGYVEGRGLCKLHYERERAGIPLDGTRRTDRRCLVEGCERAHLAKGLCVMHYQRDRRDGHPGPAEPKPTGRRKLHDGCNVTDCRRQHRARGLCEAHVKELYRENPDPEVVAAAAPSSHEQVAS